MLPRELALRDDLVALEDFARVGPDLDLPLVEDFAGVDPDLAAPEADARLVPPVDRFDGARELVDRDPVLARPELEREPVERALAERPLPRAEPPDEPLDPLELSSPDQLPLSTRCAASATASAISDPRRVALDMAVVAALDAASAASRPASRILRRAAGLALIAAAAAARPAASISRLIAALAILSTVVSVDPEAEPEEELEEDLEERLLLDFAILGLPVSQQRHSRAVTVPQKQLFRPASALPRMAGCQTR